MKKTSRRPLVVSTAIIAVTLLAMSGACSQHEPGDYQGGGRTIPTSVVGFVSGGPSDSDSSVPDVEIPESAPQETSTFDVGIPQG